MQIDPNLEFSRIVTFDQIGANPLVYDVEANPEECQRLTGRFQLVAVRSLKAHFVLSRAPEPQCYRLEGALSGDVIQSCVVTLKDVPAHVEASFEVLLRPSHGEEDEFSIDLEDERDIEYYTQESVDLGETAAQYLYLNLDPFPHAPDVPPFPKESAGEKLGPLAQGLKGLKNKK